MNPFSTLPAINQGRFSVGASVASVGSWNRLFAPFVQRPSLIVTPKYVAANSLFFSPIASSTAQTYGFSRRWGDASSQVQIHAMQKILEAGSGLSINDCATLLAIARLESGFNPDAASNLTSAAGLFQITSKTARSLELAPSDVFDTELNTHAAIRLLISHRKLYAEKYIGLNADQRAEMDYAFHHDGPSLKYGGLELAKKGITPYLREYRELVGEYRSSIPTTEDLWAYAE